MSAGDLQGLVLDVVVERDVCEGRKGLGSGQEIGIEFSLVALVAGDELPSLVGVGVDDHGGPEHICATRRVLGG